MKFYILTRADISPGLQAAQAAHAAFEFSLKHPDLMRDWHERSSYLILLNVPDELTLLEIADELTAAGVPHTVMHEPDIGNEATSIAVAPSPHNVKFSSLPLLGRELAVSP